MPDWTARALAATFLLGTAFGPAGAEGIYTCIDAHGRKLTADRPISECIDREQRELNPSGTLKRKIGPSLTVQERAAEEERSRKAADEANRAAEEKRRNRALLVRYPDRAAHDKQRAAALAIADEAIATTRKSTEESVAARRRLDAEVEFYRNDPARMPPTLRRQIQETEQHIEAQRRMMRNQDAEKARINTQFDEELARLKELWAQSAAPVAAATPGSGKRQAAAAAEVR